MENNHMTRTDIRLALPSKGALYQGAFDFFASCGLEIVRRNPRQYEAQIPALPGVTVLLQRPGDIVTGVTQGSLDFGVTGQDILSEKAFGKMDSIVSVHDALGFAPCTLNLAVPEALPVQTMVELQRWAAELGENGRPLRVATKFPHTTGAFLDRHDVAPYRLIDAEGTLEIAPVIGFADMIADLVSSGITLRDNHLRILDDGEILRSEACLIANKAALRRRPDVLAVARQMLEYFEAHLRAEGSYLVTANMRGQSPQAIAAGMREKPHIAGLQGPTISTVVGHNEATNGRSWYAVNIVVRKKELFQAIAELRSIGGSGVIVAPCSYIFEEEPARFAALLAAIEE